MSDLKESCIFCTRTMLGEETCSALTKLYYKKKKTCNFYKSKYEYEQYVDLKSGIPINAVRKNRGN